MGHSQGLTGKALLYFTTAFVSLGVFLFGYDQGVMSTLLIQENFKDYFNDPTAAQVGTMVAILEIGALISSLMVGKIGDMIGRRMTILSGAAIFVVGGTIQTCALNVLMVTIGRVIAGLGIGALSTIVPVYQSEISPPENRGKLACLEFTWNIFGYSFSVIFAGACSYLSSHMSWRLPLAMQIVMGSLLVLGCFIINETPRWLLDNDKDEEGLVVIANLHGDGDIHHPKAQQEFREIKEAVLLQRMEGERTYREMFKKYKKRVLIAMSSQMFAQCNGINLVSYYGPYIFREAGWTGKGAIWMTAINSLFYLASTIPPWYIVDKWGRRFILLSGAVVMSVALSLISYFMYLDLTWTPTLTVVFVIIYNAAFGYSWGPIPWLYPPEILPLSVRAKGASLSTSTNWVFNYLIGEFAPVLQETIHWRLYLLPAFSCICSFITVYFTYPETMGVTLEEMGSLFGDKSVISSMRRGRTMDTTSLLSHDYDEEEGFGGGSGVPGAIPVQSPSPAAMARRPIGSSPRNASPSTIFSTGSPARSSTGYQKLAHE